MDDLCSESEKVHQEPLWMNVPYPKSTGKTPACFGFQQLHLKHSSGKVLLLHGIASMQRVEQVKRVQRLTSLQVCAVRHHCCQHLRITSAHVERLLGACAFGKPRGTPRAFLLCTACCRTKSGPNCDAVCTFKQYILYIRRLSAQR